MSLINFLFSLECVFSLLVLQGEKERNFTTAGSVIVMRVPLVAYGYVLRETTL